MAELEPRGFKSHDAYAKVERASESAQAQRCFPDREVNKGEDLRSPPFSPAVSETPTSFSILYTGIEAKEMPFCSGARPKTVSCGHVNAGHCHLSEGRDSEVLEKKRIKEKKVRGGVHHKRCRGTWVHGKKPSLFAGTKRF